MSSLGPATAAALPADGATFPRSATVISAPALFNGTTVDRQYNNLQGTALPSAARTANATSGPLSNFNHRGVIVYLNVTAASGTGGLSVRIAAVDPVSGTVFYLNAAPTAVVATGITAYVVYPGSSAGNGTQVVSAPLSRTFRIDVGVGDASSYTYSVGYALIV